MSVPHGHQNCCVQGDSRTTIDMYYVVSNLTTKLHVILFIPEVALKMDCYKGGPMASRTASSSICNSYKRISTNPCHIR